MNGARPEPETQSGADAPAAPIVGCPACGGHDTRSIYRLDAIPVHSCVLVDDAQRAADYPRRPLELAFCEDCGFIYNRVFEAGVHEYGPQYDGTQEFSGTFSRFAKELVQRLVDQYDLRGRTVLEIGCGKGEFLVSLCRAGGCRGIGIDPAVTPDRAPDTSGLDVQFIADFYGPDHAHLGAEFVSCRHTLEHISDVQAFVSRVRDTVGARQDVPVFFETPDARRVLSEGAFWDIYYEHCSYFTAGSHARLFRRCGFDVVDLSLEYGGQYLLQVARPTAAPTEAQLPLERDLDEVRELAAAFPDVIETCHQRWRDFVVREAERGKRVALWGGGSKAVSFLTSLGLGESVAFAVDINPYKQGKFLPGSGHAVRGAEQLRAAPPDTVIVMNPVYRDDVAGDLAAMGIDAEVHAL